jgi:5-methyltetrahydropteroyltriglutamate--homocysteine methyltransferase
MNRSAERILTTHVGSLPRPAALLRAAGEKDANEKAYHELLAGAVSDIVGQQRAHGIDVIDDGEFGKPDFAGYVNERFGGFSRGDFEVTGAPRRDIECFPQYYEEKNRARGSGSLSRMYPPLVCTGPIRYVGHAALNRDIENLRAAVAGLDVVDVFMPAISPENAQVGKRNEYYASEEEFALALADALNEEYRAIVAAGFLVQIDDPQLITYFNRNPDKSVAECRRWVEGRIEILNHALRGIPEDRIRFHTCYSFDAAPRVGDMEMKDILDLILRVKAGAYSFEGANPRHEHEYRLWETTKLPDGKLIMPGVVAISTVVVEHPDLVAQRIIRYADIVGRERVIASTDCGFGTVAATPEVHSSIAWAKLDALVEGARRATKALWGHE